MFRVTLRVWLHDSSSFIWSSDLELTISEASFMVSMQSTKNKMVRMVCSFRSGLYVHLCSIDDFQSLCTYKLGDVQWAKWCHFAAKKFREKGWYLTKDKDKEGLS